MMKTKLLIAALMFSAFVYAQQKIEFPKALFNVGDDMAWSDPAFDDSKWKPIKTFDTWEKQGYTHDGFSWYRIRFFLPLEMRKKSKDGLHFYMAKIDDVDETYLNGKRIGKTGSFPNDPEGYVTAYFDDRSYKVDINDPALRWDAENVIAVRVYDASGNGGIGNGTPMLSINEESQEQKAKRMAWWTHDRFGMFIHWGIYSVAARGGSEMKGHDRLSDEAYKSLYFDRFDPDLYDPKAWAAEAKAAGMKYVVITAKHLDGFCLWDSKYTDFKVTNTPHGKDLLKPLVEAFRAEGIRIGFYYALIDWNHPDFPYDNHHPNSPWPDEERIKANKSRDLKKYQQYMKNQLTELLTQFGQIDELFLDYSYPGENGKGHKEWDSEGLLKLVRQLQPHILVDDRADLNHTSWGWDFMTPEQFVPHEWPTIGGVRVPWETCQTLAGSWGYARDEYTWKNTHQLVVMLIETTSKGGNLLLNVGPTARGTFDDRVSERLEGIGKWMYANSRSIYGCTQAPEEFQVPANCLLTYNPTTKRLYIHVLEWPSKSLHLPDYAGKFKYAQLLHDASEVKFHIPPPTGDHPVETGRTNSVILSLPVERPNVEVPVIEMFLE
jgi:alpha-L-fucosidase